MSISMRLLLILSILLTCFVSCTHQPPSSSQESFWKIENIDTLNEHVEALKNDMLKCESFLNSIFIVRPLSLKILFFGKRDTFVMALQEKLNLQRKAAERFSKVGAPRPAKGFFC
jgi:hypothetical protein